MTIPYFNDREYTITVGIALAEPHTVIFEVLPGNLLEAQSKDFEEVIDGGETTEDYGYSSDSDLGDDEDEKSVPLKEKTRLLSHPFDPFATPREERRSINKENGERIRLEPPQR